MLGVAQVPICATVHARCVEDASGHPSDKQTSTDNRGVRRHFSAQRDVEPPLLMIIGNQMPERVPIMSEGVRLKLSVSDFKVRHIMSLTGFSEYCITGLRCVESYRTYVQREFIQVMATSDSLPCIFMRFAVNSPR